MASKKWEKSNDPRRAALETALKWQPLTSDINDWWEDEGSKSLTYEQYAGFVSGFKYGVHGLREVIRAALKALEETAVEETRS